MLSLTGKKREEAWVLAPHLCVAPLPPTGPPPSTSTEVWMLYPMPFVTSVSLDIPSSKGAQIEAYFYNLQHFIVKQYSVMQTYTFYLLIWDLMAIRMIFTFNHYESYCFEHRFYPIFFYYYVTPGAVCLIRKQVYSIHSLIHWKSKTQGPLLLHHFSDSSEDRDEKEITQNEKAEGYQVPWWI